MWLWQTWMCITRYSGGLHVEVMGDNLDVVTKPRIVATVKGEEDIQYEAVCRQHSLFPFQYWYSYITAILLQTILLHRSQVGKLVLCNWRMLDAHQCILSQFLPNVVKLPLARKILLIAKSIWSYQNLATGNQICNTKVIVDFQFKNQ